MEDRKPDKAKVRAPTDGGCHASERHFRGQDINSSVGKAVEGRWGRSENTEKRTTMLLTGQLLDTVGESHSTD